MKKRLMPRGRGRRGREEKEGEGGIYTLYLQAKVRTDHFLCIASPDLRRKNWPHPPVRKLIILILFSPIDPEQKERERQPCRIFYNPVLLKFVWLNGYGIAG